METPCRPCCLHGNALPSLLPSSAPPKPHPTLTGACDWYRSSVELDQLCLHECTIIGKGGAHWPHPTYKVVAMDRADEPLLAKSCTGCWTQVSSLRSLMPSNIG